MEGAGLTAYEVARQERLEENKRRMEELGLTKMAKDMEGAAGASNGERKKRERRAPEVPLEPTRRSNRNEGKVVCYRFEEERGPGRPPRDGPLVKDGECEEVYSLYHVQALGSTQRDWEMFTDGYDPQTGERIYDPEKGASCHQCRQKTLGARTCCSRCKSGLGMLCGDCLFARYGEHVEEVNANPEWVCPCCRDLCNCSTHRKKRKWEATGQLHRSVKARGYASVAHYLVLNKAGGLAAKRAALATGWCPEDLEAKLKADIKELEEAGAPEEEQAPPPVPQSRQQPGAGEDEGAEQQQEGAAQEAGQDAKTKKPRKRSSGKGKGKAGAGASEAAEAEPPAPAAGEGSKASKAQRQSKPKSASPASSPAAAAGVLEASGGSGAVSAEPDAAVAEALATTAAAPQPGKGAKTGFKKRSVGAGKLDELVAAPARRRRSGVA